MILDDFYHLPSFFSNAVHFVSLAYLSVLNSMVFELSIFHTHSLVELSAFRSPCLSIYTEFEQ